MFGAQTSNIDPQTALQLLISDMIKQLPDFKNI